MLPGRYIVTLDDIPVLTAHNERAARKAQNPRTLEKVYVPAKKVVKFKVGRLMKERVAQIAAERERLTATPPPSQTEPAGTDPAPQEPDRPPTPPSYNDPPSGYGQT